MLFSAPCIQHVALLRCVCQTVTLVHCGYTEGHIRNTCIQLFIYFIYFIYFKFV